MRKSLATCALLFLITATSTIAFQPNVASAAAPLHEYWAQQGNIFQGYYLNYDFKNWTSDFYSPHVCKWYAPNYGMQGFNLRNEVATTMNSFQQVVPEFQFQETTNANEADVTFGWDGNLAQGVAAETSLTTVYIDYDRLAVYWQKICVKVRLHNWNGFYWDSSSAIRQALVHEVGHLCGLDDRYYTNPVACNPNEVTIMDTLNWYMQGGVIHITGGCDNVSAPTAKDHERIDKYWSVGAPLNLTATANGAIATWDWYDGAWAESDQLVQVFYWNGSGWTCYVNYFGTGGIGTEMEYNPVQLEVSIDHRSYGVPGGWQCIGTMPGFAQFGKWGTWTCQSIYVNP